MRRGLRTGLPTRDTQTSPTPFKRPRPAHLLYTTLLNQVPIAHHLDTIHRRLPAHLRPTTCLPASEYLNLRAFRIVVCQPDLQDITWPAATHYSEQALKPSSNTRPDPATATNTNIPDASTTTLLQQQHHHRPRQHHHRPTRPSSAGTRDPRIPFSTSVHHTSGSHSPLRDAAAAAAADPPPPPSPPQQCPRIGLRRFRA